MTKVLSIGLFLLIGLAGCGAQQQGPSLGEIESEFMSRLANRLPDNTRIGAFHILATEKVGDSVQPSFRQRVSSSWIVDEDLYREVGRIANTSVLRKTASKGTSLGFVVIATSELSFDQWTIVFSDMQLDEENKQKLDGRPLSRFSDHVVDGTDEHQRLVVKQQEEERRLKAIAEKERAENLAKMERNREKMVGQWEGSYDCAPQGATGLNLTITSNLNALIAQFRFFPLTEGQKVANGAFELVGRVDESGNFLLRPTRWIDRPKGYAFGPLQGSIEEEGERLVGRFVLRGCSSFEVSRTERSDALT